MLVKKCQLILGLVGQNPADPATRISPVAMVTGNEVDMQMEHRLPGGNAVVYADVVAVRFEFYIQTSFSLGQQTEQAGSLIVAEVEERRNVSLGDN